MDCESQGAAYSQNGSECCRARTQVGFLAQKLQCVTFFLQGILRGVGGAEHLKRFCLHFKRLAFAHGFHQNAIDVYCRACGNGLELLFVELVEVENNLKVAHGGAIVESDELYVFVTTAGANPTHYAYRLSKRSFAEYVDYFYAFHSFGGSFNAGNGIFDLQK